MIRGASDAIPAVQHNWYFPFGGWDEDGVSSAPDDETPSAPGFGHNWYFPFGGWDEDVTSSTTGDELSSGSVPAADAHTPAEEMTTALPVCYQNFYFPFGGWGGDGLLSAPDEETPLVPDSGHDWYFPFGGWGNDNMSPTPDDDHGEFVVHYLPFSGVSPAISAGQVWHERLLAQQQEDTELSRLAMQQQNPLFISPPRPLAQAQRSQPTQNASLTKRQRARL